MAGTYLIDITDARFQRAQNSDVIEFIRRTNPFAHSDVGSILFALAKQIPGAHAYCPSPRNCAYVVLHDEHDRILAIAFGQRGLGFRLASSAVDEAVAEGAVRAGDIGPDWVTFDPWNASDKTRKEKITAWARRAMSASRT